MLLTKLPISFQSSYLFRALVVVLDRALDCHTLTARQRIFVCAPRRAARLFPGFQSSFLVQGLLLFLTMRLIVIH